MLHGLLADSVHTTLASLLYRTSCTTDAAFSEVHDQWASRERHMADALSLCGSWASCNCCAV